MPGPWSRTLSSPPCSPTSTVLPGGLYLPALSSRLSTARPSRSGRPATTVESSSASNVTAGRLRWARATASPTSRSSCTSSTPDSGSSPRASSMTSVISALSSSVSARTSSSRRVRSSAGSSPPASRTSMFVRSDVTGVRSSCDASATSWRWAWTESSSARREPSSVSSIVLKRAAMRPTSSSPGTSMRRPRSSVCVMCSAAAVRSVTGWITRRLNRRANSAASSVPAKHSSASRIFSCVSVESTFRRLRANWIAPPGMATVSTRMCTPSDSVSRSERPDAAQRDRPVGAFDRDAEVALRLDEDVAGGGDDLHRTRRPARARRRLREAQARPDPEVARVAHALQLRGERLVDLPAQLVAQRDVRDDRDQHDRDADGARGQQRQPVAQRHHGSRST